MGTNETPSIKDLIKVKNVVQKAEGRQIFCTNTDESNTEKIRKMLEITFRESECKIKILTANEEPTQREKQTKKYRDTLTIKNEGKNDSEILKDLKKQIKIEEIGVRIRNIEKSSEGDIKISVEDTAEGGRKRLQEGIRNKIDSDTIV